jgi:hypothetical protein
MKSSDDGPHRNFLDRIFEQRYRFVIDERSDLVAR